MTAEASHESYDEPVTNHVGQATPDLDRAVAFYTQVLGFELDRRMAVPDEPTDRLLGIDRPGVEAAYLRLGSFVLELMQFHRDHNPDRADRVFNEPGLTHLSISVPDLDATVAAVAAHGGAVVSALPNAVVVRDPDGQLVELLTMGYRRYLAGLSASAPAAKA
jgi:lactoylglutathione lyase